MEEQNKEFEPEIGKLYEYHGKFGTALWNVEYEPFGRQPRNHIRVGRLKNGDLFLVLSVNKDIKECKVLCKDIIGWVNFSFLNSEAF